VNRLKRHGSEKVILKSSNFFLEEKKKNQLSGVGSRASKERGIITKTKRLGGRRGEKRGELLRGICLD